MLRSQPSSRGPAAKGRRPLRSAELARLAGVHVETLRYYEHRGLLPEPPRSPSGYREYSEEAVDLLRRLKSIQVLGFTLEEIRELLALHPEAAPTCGDLEPRVRRKLAEVEGKLNTLHQLRATLEELLEQCCLQKRADDVCSSLDATHVAVTQERPPARSRT